MEKPLPGQQNYLAAFIKAAQYLASLTAQQDVWSETGKVLVNFFGADVGAFGERRADGKIIAHHWTFSDRVPIQSDFGSETKEAIAEVLESGFLAWRLIFTPDPFSLAFLPITQENQVTAVMLAGYRMSEPFPKELFNVYLAVAGLVGTTAARLASEIELREHRQHLEELVEERTVELTETNELLQQEITERMRAEEIIKQMAYHDALTGLPNRRLFSDRLKVAMAHAQRNQRRLAVMLFDLDHFKDVNDTLGHSMGDRLLQAVGERLTSLLRKEDTVARMGGDEFMVLLPEVAGGEGAAEVAQKILESIREPFVFDGHEIHVTTSIGIALYPDAGEDGDTLMKNADIAMYRAKDQGRDNYQSWRPMTQEQQA